MGGGRSTWRRNDNRLLRAEVSRLRERLLDTSGKTGAQPEGSHIQAVRILPKAQQAADSVFRVTS
jgi:hypothetical protein